MINHVQSHFYKDASLEAQITCLGLPLNLELPMSYLEERLEVEVDKAIHALSFPPGINIQSMNTPNCVFGEDYVEIRFQLDLRYKKLLLTFNRIFDVFLKLNWTLTGGYINFYNCQMKAVNTSTSPIDHMVESLFNKTIQDKLRSAELSILQKCNQLFYQNASLKDIQIPGIDWNVYAFEILNLELHQVEQVLKLKIRVNCSPKYKLFPQDLDSKKTLAGFRVKKEAFKAFLLDLLVDRLKHDLVAFKLDKIDLFGPNEFEFFGVATIKGVEVPFVSKLKLVYNASKQLFHIRVADINLSKGLILNKLFGLFKKSIIQKIENISFELESLKSKYLHQPFYLNTPFQTIIVQLLQADLYSCFIFNDEDEHVVVETIFNPLTVCLSIPMHSE